LPIHRVHLKADRRDARGNSKRVREIEVPRKSTSPRACIKNSPTKSPASPKKDPEFPDAALVKTGALLRRKSRHFALAATTYTHFTSPISPLSDLIVHRILKEVAARTQQKARGEVPVACRQSPKFSFPVKLSS